MELQCTCWERKKWSGTERCRSSGGWWWVSGVVLSTGNVHWNEGCLTDPWHHSHPSGTPISYSADKFSHPGPHSFHLLYTKETFLCLSESKTSTAVKDFGERLYIHTDTVQARERQNMRLLCYLQKYGVQEEQRSSKQGNMRKQILKMVKFFILLQIVNISCPESLYT